MRRANRYWAGWRLGTRREGWRRVCLAPTEGDAWVLLLLATSGRPRRALAALPGDRRPKGVPS